VKRGCEQGLTEPFIRLLVLLHGRGGVNNKITSEIKEKHLLIACIGVKKKIRDLLYTLQTWNDTERGTWLRKPHCLVRHQGVDVLL